MAKSLEELLPRGYPRHHEHQIIEQEINRLIPVVHSALTRARIPTRFHKVQSFSSAEGEKEHEYDIIEHFLLIPRNEIPASAETDETAIGTCQQV
jgi:hypothetical protein